MFIYFRDKGDVRGREKHQCERETSVTTSLMYPDQGSNPQPFGVWDDVPTNRATWPGLVILFWAPKLFAWTDDQAP